MMVWGRAFRVTDWPMTSARAPYRFCHAAWLSITVARRVRQILAGAEIAAEHRSDAERAEESVAHAGATPARCRSASSACSRVRCGRRSELKTVLSRFQSR